MVRYVAAFALAVVAFAFACGMNPPPLDAGSDAMADVNVDLDASRVITPYVTARK